MSDEKKTNGAASFAKMADSGIDPAEAVNNMTFTEKVQTVEAITKLIEQNKQALETAIVNSGATVSPAIDVLKTLLETAPQLSDSMELLKRSLSIITAATPENIDEIRQTAAQLQKNFSPVVENLNTALAAAADYARTLAAIRERFNAGDMEALKELLFVFPEMFPYIKKDLEARNAERKTPITWEELTATREDGGTLLDELLIAAEQEAGKKQPRKPRGKKEAVIYEGDTDFIRMSSSRLTTIFYQLLGNNRQAKALAESLNKTAKKPVAKVGTVKDTGNTALVVNERKAETIIEILSNRAMKSRTAKKIFVYVLNEIYKKLFYDGKLTGYDLEISFKDMVKDGLYANESNAGNAFFKGMDTITTMRVKAVLKEGKKEETTGGIVYLFPMVKKEKNNRGSVYLNPKISWEPILKYYTAMPSSCFKLSDNAFDLEYYIFTRARQSTKSIAEKGYFTAKILSVAEFMNLPTEAKRNTRRDVIDALEKAVAEVNGSLDPSSFSIEICTNTSGTIQEYLGGYLKVNLSNGYADTFTQIASNKQKRIEAAVKKSERVKEAAAVKVEADRLKEEQKEQKRRNRTDS